VLFRQGRVGRYGEVFEMFKLRTMIVDAEKKTGPVWASQNDPRVTPIGKFLRKSRVDEIPQLVNVLKGQMSIIGPRPERPEIIPSLAKEIIDYTKRLSVRPGITGLAQIKQSYDANIKDVRRKVKFDILYIKRMCFLTDLRIILSTFLVMATGRGAR
jgi:lipopolysaccharide/colanic/teichoic acid biosynthesis glycosyltransferase